MAHGRTLLIGPMLQTGGRSLFASILAAAEGTAEPASFGSTVVARARGERLMKAIFIGTAVVVRLALTMAAVVRMRHGVVSGDARALATRNLSEADLTARAENALERGLGVDA